MNILKQIRITNFRNHGDFLVDLNKKTTLIVGENGSGKTSILEAIYICLQGKSFRATDNDILKNNTNFYKIELDFNDGSLEKVYFDKENKRFVYNGKESKRILKKNKYPVVLFLPEDLHLIQTSPTKRRDYFNKFFSQIDEKYNHSLLRYNKALKQRNELLKKENTTKKDLFSWDIMLAKYGSEITRIRKQTTDKINRSLTDNYRQIANNNDEVEIKYTGDILSESEYLNKITDDLNKDKILGYTNYGIHRDDFIFYFNNKQADGSASRGETRSIILASKFIEASIIYEVLNKKPIILLDDVFSELDEVRQKSLIKNFKNNQVILTSVDEVKL